MLLIHSFFFIAWYYTGVYFETVLVLFPSIVSHLIHVHLPSPELCYLLSTTCEADESKLDIHIPLYFSLPYYSWVLCPVIFLVFTSILIRSYILFPVPTSAQLFWGFWNSPTSAYRFLKILWCIPVSFCQITVVLSHLNYYLLSALYFLVSPLSLTPSGPLMHNFPFCACSYLLITFSFLFPLALFLSLHNFCYLLLLSIYLCLWVSNFPFFSFICFFSLGHYGPSYPCWYVLLCVFIFYWCC